MTQWQFTQQVAATFEDHAVKHIPNYRSVIEKSVDICRRYPKHARIIDVGSATGYTLTQLETAGFTNLVGVDSSQSMLDHNQATGAELICSAQFPVEQAPFDVIIINWTLHFMSNKIDYLQSVYNALSPGGALILSDKTSLDEYAIEHYHQFKKSQGVSQHEIDTKAQSLVGVMFVDNIDWYMNTLKSVGFKKIHVFDAHWCFTSFVCFK